MIRRFPCHDITRSITLLPIRMPSQSNYRKECYAGYCFSPCHNANRLESPHRVHVLFDCCHIVTCGRVAQVPCSIAIFIKITGSALLFYVKLMSSCNIQFGRSIRQRRLYVAVAKGCLAYVYHSSIQFLIHY